MKTLLLIKENEVRAYQLNSSDALAWAQYWFNRRIEKEGWVATKAYIVSEKGLPVENWLKQYKEDEIQAEKVQHELEELRQYERLKKKYNKVKK